MATARVCGLAALVIYAPEHAQRRKKKRVSRLDAALVAWAGVEMTS
jgi:hypothetical protein